MKRNFDGYPSFKLSQRPFFSIIIPCYNSHKTIAKLLQSIADQDMEDEIEVIISDDCSPDQSYLNIVDQFTDELSIRLVQTDYNFAPGNTREKGVSVAEGIWVLFADHDDEFIPGTLKQIKEELIRTGEQYYAIANFIEQDAETGEKIREMIGTRNWNHAKFYNLDNFWKRYDIHFKKDLLTHEDIYISSVVNCAIQDANGDNPLHINIFCYIWNNRPTTISREIYGNHSFLESFFKDYIESTARVYLERFINDQCDPQYAVHSMIEVLLYCYFYTESFKFHHPLDYIRENDDECRRLLIDVKEATGITNKFIWDYAAQNDADLYVKVRDAASIGAGPYIEEKTFEQWLDFLHRDLRTRTTMSDAMHK